VANAPVTVTVQMQIAGEAAITGFEPIPDITVTKGTALEKVELPSVVTAVYSGGTRAEVAVVWNTEGLDLNTIGEYTLEGTVEGTEIKAVIKVIVIRRSDGGNNGGL